VLIAESDPELALMLSRALKSEGFTTESCSDGMDAVRSAHSNPPDLLVCGLYLPGLGGIRLLRYLRSEPAFSTIPVIILAPRLDRAMAQRARRAGADLVLELPVGITDLAARCAELLSESHSTKRSAPLPGSAPDRAAILEELAQVMERRLDRIEAMRDFALELSESPTVREIYRMIAAGVVAGLGFDRVQVFRYNSSSEELHAESALGRGLPAEPPEAPVRLQELEGLPAERALRSGRQVCSWEVELPEVRLSWCGSSRYADTPLVSGSKTLGLIRCDFGTSGRSFARDDLDALRQLSALASVALSNAMDLEEISEGREQTAAVLTSLDSAVVVVDTGLRVVEATSRTKDLFGVSPDAIKGRTLSDALPLIGQESRREMLRKVFLEGRSGLEPSVSVNLQGHSESFLDLRFVPYRRGGHMTGIVILATDVTEEHTLRENLKKRNDELETLSRIGRDLNSSLEIDKLPDLLADSLQKLYPGEAIAVLLPPESSEVSIPDTLRIRAARGYPDNRSVIGHEALPLGVPRYPDGEPGTSPGRPTRSSVAGIIANAVLTKRPINVPDVTQDARYVQNLPTTMSELCVPMVVRDRVVGVIDLQSSIRHRFSPDSMRRVGTLANHAAIAIENARLHAQAWDTAQRDRLTGLRNLRYFEERLKEELERASRSAGYEVSLIMIDIDDFKHYNDAFGHPMGNLLLRTVARAISSALREYNDILVRYGGEEFVCILPLTGTRVAAEIAERIRQRVIDLNYDIPHASQQPLGCVSVSLGVSTYPGDVADREKALEAADSRMYMAKRAGKNRVFAPALNNCPPAR